MYIQQLYTNCLAQAAYYVESEGEALIIDPLRDYDAYLKLASDRGATIKYVFETHFHADFVSGHIDLADKTGAVIVYGPETNTSLKVHIAKDGEIIKLGKVSFEVLHTPGHTLESTCYLLKDEQQKDHAVFTGDTLFVGDVGRPDLLDGVMTKEELASKMYHSLNAKLKPLADEVILYPGHGPGSACGKNIGKETFSTIGEQKRMNYALQEMNEKEFIQKVTDGIQPAPAYFFKDAKLNKNGYTPIEKVINNGLKKLSVAEFTEHRHEGALVIDSRSPDEFEKGFIPKSYNFGLNGQYAIWAATLIELNRPILLVTEKGKEEESIVRLSRVGFDNIIGYLEGGFEAWAKEGKRYDMIISVDPEEFALDYKHDQINVLDVRKPTEFENGHIEGAEPVSLQDIHQKMDGLSKEETYYVHCAGGYRSMIAASILKANGFHNIKNVHGGYGKIKETNVPVVQPQSA